MTGSNSQTSQVFSIDKETLEIRWKYFRLGNQTITFDIYKAGDRITPAISFNTSDQQEGAKQIKLDPGSHYMNVQTGDIQNWTVTLIKQA